MLSYLPPLLFAFSGATVFLAGMRRVQRTTLVGPWLWTITAFAFAAFVTAWSGTEATESTGTANFLLAMFFFCPLMSVLGAKRPQNNAWHFVVLSLWLVLAIPAAEVFFLRRAPHIRLHDARAWFLWALIGVAFLNYVFTRHFIAGTLYCVAMVVWLAPHLPGVRKELTLTLVWVSLLLSAAVAAAFLFRNPSATNIDDPHPLDDDWFRFRNAYGVTWGLRVMERVNNAATTSGWPARLEWDGFHVEDGISDEQSQGLKASFDGIMRRFNDVTRKPNKPTR